MVRTVEPKVARASKALWRQRTNSLPFMTENRQFSHFIIITMILTTTHDSQFVAGGFRSSLGGSIVVYLVERLLALTDSRWFTAVLAVIVFGVAHVPAWGTRFAMNG
jgi:hypothetical protein